MQRGTIGVKRQALTVSSNNQNAFQAVLHFSLLTFVSSHRLQLIDQEGKKRQVVANLPVSS